METLEAVTALDRSLTDRDTVRDAVHGADRDADPEVNDTRSAIGPDVEGHRATSATSTATATGGTAVTATAPPRRVDARLLAVAGSACIAFSPILIALAHVSPGTATFFRCVLALPILAPLAWWERRRRRAAAARSGTGTGARRRPLVLLAGGVLLGIDMTLWADAVAAVGAGVSTVLVNVQVIILPLLAFLVLGERVRGPFVMAVPVMLGGVALAGGLAGHAVSGPDPVRGTVTALLAACAYAGYLLLVRLGAGPGERFASVGIATAGAVVSSAVLGTLWRGLELTPGWVALGWLALLAVVGQVVGWVLIASALPRLPSSTGASILLLQPVAAVLLGMVLLGERPSGLQVLGCVVVIGAVAFAARIGATRTGRNPSGPNERRSRFTGSSDSAVRSRRGVCRSEQA